jgi:hypothetical protein
MARRNLSYTQMLMDAMGDAEKTALGVAANQRAEAENTRAGKESEARLGLIDEQKRGAKVANDSKTLDYDQALKGTLLKDNLSASLSHKSGVLEGKPTADGHAVDFQAAKAANKDTRQADMALWNFTNPDKPLSAEALQAKRDGDNETAEAQRALPGAIGEDPDLSDTEKAFYQAHPEKFGDKLKPAAVTYLPGADGYVAAPTRGGGPAKKVVDETGGAVKPQIRTAEKTPEQIEAEAAARARGTASVPKALSAEDRQVVSMKVNSLKVARQQLQKVKEAAAAANASMLSGKGRGWMPTKENAAFEKAVAALKPTITAMTRIPGVGAMSDFETRLAMAPFPEPGEYGDVNDQAIQALEDLITQTESGYAKLGTPEQAGGGGSASSAVPVGTVKVNKQGIKVRKTATGWEQAE